MFGTVLKNVREYAEEYPVRINRLENGRIVVCALNEGGHNGTDIDLVDLLTALGVSEAEGIAERALFNTKPGSPLRQ